MATFVLVHPAWFGGWCWTKVMAQLRAKGLKVYAPTMTGLGERSHLAGRDVSLQTHIDDVANVMRFEGLNDVVLVGTSSSGTVITGVAAEVPELIDALVYLDAFVPEDGQCTRDLLSPERQAGMDSMVADEGDGWLLPRFAPPPWPVIVRDLWQVTDEADAEWLLPRLRPTPYSHFTEPVRLSAPIDVPRIYVRCLRSPFAGPTPFDRFAENARSSPDWDYHEIDGPHVAYITHPDDVTRVLLDPLG